jgi:hypothetical protein
MHHEILFVGAVDIPKIDGQDKEVAIDIGSTTPSTNQTHTRRKIHVVDFLASFIVDSQFYAWRRGNWTPILTQLENGRIEEATLSPKPVSCQPSVKAREAPKDR